MTANPSDPALLDAARKQLAIVKGDAMAFLGWWMAWKVQDGVNPDDLVDLVKAAGLDVP
jgi:hypothetical protein